MTEPRHIGPSPLGGGDGLPYSKGLMTRTLMAAGVSATKAYELARAIERDLAARGELAVELERVEALAVDQLGEEEATHALHRNSRSRSSRSSAARPGRGSRGSRPRWRTAWGSPGSLPPM